MCIFLGFCLCLRASRIVLLVCARFHISFRVVSRIVGRNGGWQYQVSVLQVLGTLLLEVHRSMDPLLGGLVRRVSYRMSVCNH